MIWQAWNAQTATDLSLSGPVGQVYALVVGNDLLFAGTQVYLLTVNIFYDGVKTMLFCIKLYPIAVLYQTASPCILISSFLGMLMIN